MAATAPFFSSFFPPVVVVVVVVVVAVGPRYLQRRRVMIFSLRRTFCLWSEDSDRKTRRIGVRLLFCFGFGYWFFCDAVASIGNHVVHWSVVTSPDGQRRPSIGNHVVHWSVVTSPDGQRRPAIAAVAFSLFSSFLIFIFTFGDSISPTANGRRPLSRIN